jgi:hypothetical protein
MTSCCLYYRIFSLSDTNCDYRHERRNLILSEIYGFTVAGSGPTATLADNLSPCAVYGEAIDFSLYRNVPADMMVRARRVLTGHVRDAAFRTMQGSFAPFSASPSPRATPSFPTRHEHGCPPPLRTRAQSQDEHSTNGRHTPHWNPSQPGYA